MELSDWHAGYADPALRERLRPLFLAGAGALAEQAVQQAEARRGDPQAARELAVDVMQAKGWHALGAFDPSERSRALDLLGFQKQLVFSTFAATQFTGSDLEVLYGGTTAHNRGMAEFCAADERLIAVGMGPSCSISAGAGARCAAASTPTGSPDHDFLGGGENIRSKDYMVIHQPPEAFLACMVLDGLFERFSGLRGGCIEQGALWVVPWLRRLDIAQETFQRTEPALRLPEKASDYVRRHLRFTPFNTEPVGWLIEQGGEELFLFSSDYPHPEGGRRPLERFEASLTGIGHEARERFYWRNFSDLFPGSAAPAG